MTTEIERHYFDYTEGVHDSMRTKYDWFVRISKCGETIRPYYCDGIIADITADALVGLKDAHVEVIDNKWSTEVYADHPYKYTASNYDGDVRHGTGWRGHNGEATGYCGGGWEYRRYFDMKTGTSVDWRPRFGFLRVSYGALSVEPNGPGHFRLMTRTGTLLRNDITRDSRGLCPHDLRKDVVVPVINEMRVQRLKGGYEPLVAIIMEAFDVHATEVREAPL